MSLTLADYPWEHKYNINFSGRTNTKNAILVLTASLLLWSIERQTLIGQLPVLRECLWSERHVDQLWILRFMGVHVKVVRENQAGCLEAIHQIKSCLNQENHHHLPLVISFNSQTQLQWSNFTTFVDPRIFEIFVIVNQFVLP